MGGGKLQCECQCAKNNCRRENQLARELYHPFVTWFKDYHPGETFEEEDSDDEPLCELGESDKENVHVHVIKSIHQELREPLRVEDAHHAMLYYFHIKSYNRSLLGMPSSTWTKSDASSVMKTLKKRGVKIDKKVTIPS